METENSEADDEEVVTLEAQKFGGREPVQFACADADFIFEINCRDGAFGEANTGRAVSDERGCKPFDIGTVANPAETLVVPRMFKRPLKKRPQLRTGL